MRAVGQARPQSIFVEVLGDLTADNCRTQWHIACRDPLGDYHDINFDARVVVNAEPFARAPETAHDFINDEQHPVTITNFAQAVEIDRRRLHDPARTAVAFNKNRPAVFRAFTNYYILHHLRDNLVAFFLRATTINGIAIRIGVGRADYPGNAGFVR